MSSLRSEIGMVVCSSRGVLIYDMLHGTRIARMFVDLCTCVCRGFISPLNSTHELGYMFCDVCVVVTLLVRFFPTKCQMWTGLVSQDIFNLSRLLSQGRPPCLLSGYQ